MSQSHLPGSPPVPILLRRSARARRLSLRISRLDGRVTLTLPRGVDEQEGLDFARSKEAWIRDHLAQQRPEIRADLGAELPIDGTLRRIVPGAGRAVHLSETELAVPGAAAQVARRVEAFVKTRARDRLIAASDHYAARLNRPYARISLRDTRSRWGSCSSAGALMYSWRLILMPPAVLDYVAAHEVAHLAHMDHSPAFWAQVRQLYGDYDGPRHWLKENGSDLHRYRFRD